MNKRITAMLIILGAITITLPSLLSPGLDLIYAQDDIQQLNVAVREAETGAEVIVFTIENDQANIIYTETIEDRNKNIDTFVQWFEPNLGFLTIETRTPEKREYNLYLVNESGLVRAGANNTDGTPIPTDWLVEYEYPYAVFQDHLTTIQEPSKVFYILNVLTNTYDTLEVPYYAIGTFPLQDNGNIIYPFPSFPAEEVREYDLVNRESRTIFRLKDDHRLLRPTDLPSYWYTADMIQDQNNMVVSIEFEFINIVTGEISSKLTHTWHQPLDTESASKIFQNMLVYRGWFGIYDTDCQDYCEVKLLNYITGDERVLILHIGSRFSRLRIVSQLDNDTFLIKEDSNAKESDTEPYFKIWRASFDMSAELVGYLPMYEGQVTDSPFNYDVLNTYKWVLIGDSARFATTICLIDLESNQQIFEFYSDESLGYSTKFSPYGVIITYNNPNDFVIVEASGQKIFTLLDQDHNLVYWATSLQPDNRLLFNRTTGIDGDVPRQQNVMVRNLTTGEETIVIENATLRSSRFYTHP